MDTDSKEALTYLAKEPDIDVLRSAYEATINDLSSYADLCRSSYDERRNYWPGKSRDLRKHGADAFPWEGASDTEAHVIDERINRLVAICLSALNRANVRAFPTEASDIPRAKVVSSFMKWMTTSGYIPRFKREMELGANYLFERGIFVTYVGWHREDRSYLQRFELQQIAAVAPDLANLILSGQADDEVIAKLKTIFPTVNDKRAKKALKEMRKTGVCELPVVRRQIDAPIVKTLAPDSEFLFPSYVTDPQRAPYCFWKTYYTAQELKNKVSTDNWDEAWVDHIIEYHSGIPSESVQDVVNGRRLLSITNVQQKDNDLIEVVYGYQRLIDKEDNSEGIYCTVFHRNFAGNDEVKGFAKFELMNGYEDYPVVVTRLSEDCKRLYDVQTIPDLLRGIQNQVKVERDSRIDRNSLATLPPIMHPIGNAPTDWGPGRYVPYKRMGEFQFGPVPQYNPGSVEMEKTMQEQADRLVGLDLENPLSQLKQNFIVEKYLSHCAEVLRMCYRCFQRFGPDQVFFQVTGVADPQQFNKGNPDENYNVSISYDVLNNDPENQESKLQQLVSLIQLDRNGRINVDALLDVIAASIDPVLASAILQPSQAAQEQVVKQVTDDLTKIAASIEMPARPNGAQIALQIIQQYTSQPDVQQRLSQDEAFAARLEKYAEAYKFQITQAQNAEIGKIGVAPAQMGQINMQGT